VIGKQEYINRFKSLYRKKTGKDLSDDEAVDLFEKLVVLVDAVYKPVPKKYAKQN
jgi:hypothetical protein